MVFRMIVKGAIIFACCWGMASSAYAQASARFLDGGISIGYDSRACNNAIEGAVRYNSATGLEYCNGTNWTGPGGCAAPASCPQIGDQCGDNTIFAGCHPIYYSAVFVHPQNQSAGAAWSMQTVANAGAQNNHDGRINQQWIVANRVPLTNYAAFKLCDDLNQVSALGHGDWYLPSRVELYMLFAVSPQINSGPGDSFIATQYWSSTENNNNTAWFSNFSIGSVPSDTKSTLYDVRCIRRN